MEPSTPPDTAQFVALRTTQLAYRDALNHVSQYAFERSKMGSGRGLQCENYDEIRVKSHLSAQMAYNVPRQVVATYKTLGTMPKPGKQGLPRNGIRDWISHPSMSLRR